MHRKFGTVFLTSLIGTFPLPGNLSARSADWAPPVPGEQQMVARGRSCLLVVARGGSWVARGHTVVARGGFVLAVVT